MENYEGYLFLYQEGELDSTTCAEVERFLLEHPDIREEMEAYYDPTLVVTAEPPARHKRRTLPLWRWAAAACVVLALGYGTYLTISQPTENSTLVADASPVIPPNPKHPSTLQCSLHPSHNKQKYSHGEKSPHKPNQSKIPSQLFPLIPLSTIIRWNIWHPSKRHPSTNPASW